MQDSPKPHVSSSFSYSTSSSSSPSDSPLGRRGGGGNRLPSFMRRLTRQRKLRHVTDEELGLRKASKSVPVSPQATPTYRAPGGSDPWWSTAVPQPLPLPEFASARVNSGSPNDGSGYGGGSNPTQLAFMKNNHLGAKIVKTPTYFRRGFHKDLSLDSQHLRLKIPVRSAPTSNLPSPTVSPQKPSVWDFSTDKLTAPLSQRWSARELAPSNIPGQLSPEPAARTSRSLDHSPLDSPPTQRHTNFNLKSPRGIPFLLHNKSPSEASILSNDGNVNAKLHPLPRPPCPQPLSQSLDASHNIEKPCLSPRKGEWQKGKLIGRGTFGRVYVATNRKTGALCAMKEVDLLVDDPRHSDSIMQLEQEIEILQQLKHPNIVQYYGSEIVDDQFYIYMEYVYPGSVNTYVREHFGCMTESIVRHFTRHILSGLAYLHSTNTIHRDIKGANLLVDSMGTVKLADFGMAKHLKGPVSVLSLKGSPYWMAPEILQGTINKETSPSIAFAVDIWSVGCTIIEMLTGKPPWGELEGPQAMFKVLNKIPEIPENLSSEGKDFLQCCFQRNPVERPSAHWLLQHPFVRNIHDEDDSFITQPYSKLKFEGTSSSTVIGMDMVI